MYSDPALIRKHVVKLSLNDREADLLKALCAYTGDQPAALLRQILMEQAVNVFHGPDFGQATPAMQRTNPARMVA